MITVYILLSCAVLSLALCILVTIGAYRVRNEHAPVAPICLIFAGVMLVCSIVCICQAVKRVDAIEASKKEKT